VRVTVVWNIYLNLWDLEYIPDPDSCVTSGRDLKDGAIFAKLKALKWQWRSRSV
jgi:hypothetical protein